MEKQQQQQQQRTLKKDQGRTLAKPSLLYFPNLSLPTWKNLWPRKQRKSPMSPSIGPQTIAETTTLLEQDVSPGSHFLATANTNKDIIHRNMYVDT